MNARFPGRCKAAKHPVRVGDPIMRDGGGWSHPGCRTGVLHGWNPDSPYNLNRADLGEALDEARARARDDAEYARGVAEGERYLAEKAVYGAALAEKFRAMDEWNSYWKHGEDY